MYFKPLTYTLAIFAALLLMGAGKKVVDTGDRFRTVNNEAFKVGEELKYRVHYGFIDAGEATIEVKEMKSIGGRPCYRVVGSGRSVGTFDWFFKVRDHYESYIDQQGMFPWVFIRRVNEGGYKINQDYIFNHFKGTVKSKQKDSTYTIPENVQDMISMFYYARTLDFTSVKKGDEFEIMTFLDEELWPFKIKYVGKEEIKSKLGTFRCLKFHPVIQAGRVFKAEEDLTIWVTDDKNHIPVRLKAEVLVGSIKMDLKKYKGIANPVALVGKK